MVISSENLPGRREVREGLSLEFWGMLRVRLLSFPSSSVNLPGVGCKMFVGTERGTYRGSALSTGRAGRWATSQSTARWSIPRPGTQPLKPTKPSKKGPLSINLTKGECRCHPGPQRELRQADGEDILSSESGGQN